MSAVVDQIVDAVVGRFLPFLSKPTGLFMGLRATSRLAARERLPGVVSSPMRGLLRRRRATSVAVTPTVPTDATAFARARPESIVVEECFDYEQEISRNPSIGSTDTTTGRIAISLPYDGHEFFTRDAAEDVERYLNGLNSPVNQLEALVGHLVFVDYQHTNLSDVFSLDRRLDAFPLRVPVRTTELDSSEALLSDEHEYRRELDYLPSRKRLELVPVTLDVELADPDHSDLLTTTEMLRGLMSDDPQLEQVADNIKRFIGFKPFLQLEITVRVVLPAGTDVGEHAVTVRRVGVGLPTSTSLATSSLELLGVGDATLQHNPHTWNLEWFDVPMTRTATVDGQPRHYKSPKMTLLFKEPGELFVRRELVVEADVEVSGELLSGAGIRAFNALGERYPKNRDPLTLRSVLRTRCTVVLRDAFAGRLVSPYQSFHFDEIIPDPLRITDIQAALSDQRFSITQQWSMPTQKGKRQLRHFLIAERADGPDTMVLWVFVEGMRHPTQREARQPSGNRYTSKLASGELRMFVRGQVRRDTSNLVHEINELHLALRERFRRLKVHR